MPSVGRTPEQVERGRLSWKVQQSLLRNEPLDPEDQAAYDAMPDAFKKRVEKNASQLPEVSAFLRLPAVKAVQFFDDLTDAEKKNVAPLILQKIENNQTLTEQHKDDLRKEFDEKIKGMGVARPTPKQKSIWGAW